MRAIGVASPCHSLTPSPVCPSGLERAGLAAGRNLYPCTRQVVRQQRSEVVSPDRRPSGAPKGNRFVSMAPTQSTISHRPNRVSDRFRGGNVSTHRYELASSCSSAYQPSAWGSLLAQRSGLTSLRSTGYITSSTHDDSLPSRLTGRTTDRRPSDTRFLLAPLAFQKDS